MTAWAQIVEAFAGARLIEGAASPDKVCNTCKATLPLSEFYHKSGRSLTSVMSRCKTCFKAEQRERNARSRAAAERRKQLIEAGLVTMVGR